MTQIIRCGVVMIAAAIVSLVMFFQDDSVEYPLYDCVTYFDDEARYQLIEIQDYYIQDVKQGNTIFTNVTAYAFYENILYVEFNEFMGYDGEPRRDNEVYKRLYGTYNIIDESKVIHDKIEDFDEDVISVFRDDKMMIKLNSDRSGFERWISEFIPLKYRKR